MDTKKCESPRQRFCCYCGKVTSEIRLIGTATERSKRLHDLILYLGGVSVKEGIICRNCQRRFLNLNRRIEELRKRSIFFSVKNRKSVNKRKEDNTTDKVTTIQNPGNSKTVSATNLSEDSIKKIQDDHSYCEETVTKNMSDSLSSLSKFCEETVTKNKLSPSVPATCQSFDYQENTLNPPTQTLNLSTEHNITQTTSNQSMKTVILPTVSMTASNQTRQQVFIPTVSIATASSNQPLQQMMISTLAKTTGSHSVKPLILPIVTMSSEQLPNSTASRNQFSMATPGTFATCQINQSPLSIPVSFLPLPTPAQLVPSIVPRPLKPKLDEQSSDVSSVPFANRKNEPILPKTNTSSTATNLLPLTPEELSKVYTTLSYCTPDELAKCCLEIPRVRNSIQKQLAEENDFVVKSMGNIVRGFVSLLRKDMFEIKTLDWSTISDEFESKLPFIFNMLVTFACGTRNSDEDKPFEVPEKLKPRLALVYAVIMQYRFPYLTGLQRTIANYFREEKRIKKILRTLQPLGVCIGYTTSLRAKNQLHKEKSDEQADASDKEVNPKEVKVEPKKVKVKPKRLKDKLSRLKGNSNIKFKQKKRKLSNGSSKSTDAPLTHDRIVSSVQEPVEDIIVSLGDEYHSSKVTEDHISDHRGNKWHIAMVADTKSQDCHRKKGNVVIITKKNLDNLLSKNSDVSMVNEETIELNQGEQQHKSSSMEELPNVEHDHVSMATENNTYSQNQESMVTEDLDIESVVTIETVTDCLIEQVSEVTDDSCVHSGDESVIHKNQE